MYLQNNSFDNRDADNDYHSPHNILGVWTLANGIDEIHLVDYLELNIPKIDAWPP